MGVWSRLLRWRKVAEAPVEQPEAAPRAADQETNTVELPIEPFVFECQECGKVFEARRMRPRCPECDSSNASVLSE
jgi:Zn finger protein HypA/HybF involved in hydrogenase expression